MKGKAWRPLRAGDIVDVVAPGYATKPEAVDRARQFLLSWGLVPRIPPNLMAPHFLHANDDDSRLILLKKALLAEDSAAVWCLRGGYGSNRLLPGLARMKAPRRAKLLVGISDITSLHLFLSQEWGWATLHGPLLERMSPGRLAPRDHREMRDLVFGRVKQVRFQNLKPMNEAARRLRRVKAPVIGGNLTVLQSTLGTPWQLRPRGHFLFVEDIGERGYRVDRIFEQFRQAGLFRGCRGLLLGDFTAADEPDGRNLVPLVFRRWAEDLEIPVFRGLPAGHGKVQRPVPFATSAVLSGGGQGVLTIESGGAKR
ncbi:MAG: LD-carboxypeptidase [Bdellovibrionaceae bacterium]|nr:LD-carboxypeptidase [Pseudobdellovibrionaceae bacterium]MBX3034267.1 LD-carboxypeptidase [Pseudobdellovibrionaceae bacterium]